MEQFHKKIDGIRKMLEEMKGHKYAIANPDLVSLDEYVKSLYIQVLCTVVQYENEPVDMQILYLKRIVNGIGVEDPVEEYMRKALEISETDIQEFLSHMKEGKARYYFALDAILLVSMAQTSQPSYEYVAELIELLEIDKQSLSHLAMVAQSVLVQQSADFDCAKEHATEYTAELNFMPYIHNYYVGAIVDTPIEKYYASPDIVLENEIELPTSYEERLVTFENLVITVSQDWHFNGCEKVRFKNCRLVGNKGNLQFDSVGTIELENSSFTEFDNRVARIEGVNSFVVKNCKFVKCGYKSNQSPYGGVFGINIEGSGYIKKVVLENNELQNCYISTDYNSYIAGVFVGCTYQSYVEEMKVINNYIRGCRYICSGNHAKSLIARLRTENLVETGNTVIGETFGIFGS